MMKGIFIMLVIMDVMALIISIIGIINILVKELRKLVPEKEIQIFITFDQIVYRDHLNNNII